MAKKKTSVGQQHSLAKNTGRELAAAVAKVALGPQRVSTPHRNLVGKTFATRGQK